MMESRCHTVDCRGRVLRATNYGNRNDAKRVGNGILTLRFVGQSLIVPRVQRVSVENQVMLGQD